MDKRSYLPLFRSEQQTQKLRGLTLCKTVFLWMLLFTALACVLLDQWELPPIVPLVALLLTAANFVVVVVLWAVIRYMIYKELASDDAFDENVAADLSFLHYRNSYRAFEKETNRRCLKFRILAAVGILCLCADVLLRILPAEAPAGRFSEILFFAGIVLISVAAFLGNYTEAAKLIRFLSENSVYIAEIEQQKNTEPRFVTSLDLYVDTPPSKQTEYMFPNKELREKIRKCDRMIPFIMLIFVLLAALIGFVIGMLFVKNWTENSYADYIGWVIFLTIFGLMLATLIVQDVYTRKRTAIMKAQYAELWKDSAKYENQIKIHDLTYEYQKENSKFLFFYLLGIIFSAFGAMLVLVMNVSAFYSLIPIGVSLIALILTNMRTPQKLKELREKIRPIEEEIEKEQCADVFEELDADDENSFSL